MIRVYGCFNLIVFALGCAMFVLGALFEVMNCVLVLRNVIRRTTSSLVIVVPILFMVFGAGIVWDHAPDSIQSAVRGILSQHGWWSVILVLSLEIILCGVDSIVHRTRKSRKISKTVLPQTSNDGRRIE